MDIDVSLNRILIDSNLLLLLFVGSVNESFVQTFKRTQKYTREDYRLLRNIVSQASSVMVTPNILTEVSNLANAISGDYRKRFSAVFMEQFEILSEEYVASSEVSRNSAFTKFGLTDAAIVALLRPGITLLTDDFPLAQYVRSQEGAVLNFNNVRLYGWEKY